LILLLIFLGWQERQEEEEQKERERAEKASAEAEKQRKANLTAESFKEDPHGLSEWYKEKGNTLYKNKEFDQAIEQYTKVVLLASFIHVLECRNGLKAAGLRG
jgi:tetratricopeptide (TPR) repeat protein